MNHKKIWITKGLIFSLSNGRSEEAIKEEDQSFLENGFIFLQAMLG